MSDIRNYQDLEVWQKSMDLLTEIYGVCKCLPKEETYALGDQMRRAAVSIPSNIAEGFGRSGSKEFSHFLSFSLGSAYELQTQILACERLGFIEHSSSESIVVLIDRIVMMIKKLVKSLVY